MHNASSDDTSEIVDDFKQKHQVEICNIYEESTGLSKARNKGLLCAHGNYLKFVDDDVEFDEMWFTE